MVAKEEERIGMHTLMKHAWVNDNCPMLEPFKKKAENFNEMDLDSVALEVGLIFTTFEVNTSFNLSSYVPINKTMSQMDLDRCQV